MKLNVAKRGRCCATDYNPKQEMRIILFFFTFHCVKTVAYSS